MADGVEIGKGQVKVTADTTEFDKDMAAMPRKGAAAMDATERAMEARARANGRARDERGRFIAGAGGGSGADSLLGTQVEARLQRVGDAGITAGQKINQGSGNAAMGLMMVSQFVDDMQYGFRSVVNNVPSLGMAVGNAIGMSAEAALKFGGALGIAAVAANLLITHWDDLIDLMGMGKTLTEAQEMEKLAAATKRTADEQARLNRYKKEQDAGKRLIDKPTSGQAKTTTEIDNIIADLGNDQATGFERLVGGLVQARRAANRGEKILPEEQEKLDNWTKLFGDTPYSRMAIEREKKTIQARIDEEDDKNARKTVEGATFDAVTRKQLINEIRRNPGAFPEGAADALAGVKPAKNTADQKAEDLAAKQAEQLDAANKADFDRYKQQRDAEDSRLAHAMTGSVGEAYLINPKMGVEEMQAEVRKAMERAGIGAGEIAKAVEGTAKKLRENMDKAVEQRALDKGITLDQARYQLRVEAFDRDHPRQTRVETKAEVMSTESYLNKLLVAGAVGRDDIPRDQLAEARATNKKLEAMIKELKAKKDQGTATFARGRA